MKQCVIDELESKGLRYKESDFWYNEIIGKEIVRFQWNKVKYRGHSKLVKGTRYFDDFIMDELKYLAEKNSGGFKL